MIRSAFRLLVAAACAAAAAAPAMAADFYAGKSIDFIIGADVGGGYDTYARVIGRHLGKHIPGNPQIVMKNLPGAGSGKAATYLSTTAPQDGTSIGALFPGAVVGPLLDPKFQKTFDPVKLQYLATADASTRVCVTYATSKIKMFEDALKEKMVLGASAAGGSSRDYANMLRKAAGAQISVVAGYKGSREIGLAMERGEVDGMCGFDWSSIRAQHADWLRDNKLHVLVQVGLESYPDLTKAGVPEVWKYIKNDADKKAVELIISQQVFGRPYVAPPATPAAQVKILRDAFTATFNDAEFLADAKTSKLDVNPLDGEKVQQVVEKVYASPPATVARAKELIAD
ncbi:MAG TPA: tripartite tricarboxylate transporter substrate-binding protein [Xanthobacteraceae bacterium]|nr:tripartite tricarboxylate transporter substrate-binding protein [Xanthobacteraceae bacterium]